MESIRMFSEEKTVEQMVLDTLRGSVSGNVVAGTRDCATGCCTIEGRLAGVVAL